MKTQAIRLVALRPFLHGYNVLSVGDAIVTTPGHAKQLVQLGHAREESLPALAAASPATPTQSAAAIALDPPPQSSGASVERDAANPSVTPDGNRGETPNARQPDSEVLESNPSSTGGVAVGEQTGNGEPAGSPPPTSAGLGEGLVGQSGAAALVADGEGPGPAGKATRSRRQAS